MGWEIRQNGNRYFYVSQRLPGDRIRKKYCGNGTLAEIESIRLERRKAQRDQVAREKQLTAAAELILTQQTRNTEDLVVASLLIAGFHNPKHRGWRRKRMITSNGTLENKEALPVAGPTRSFHELVQAARGGDGSVIPELRKMMGENPELAKNTGDLAAQSQIYWVDLVAGRDLYYRECLLRRVANLKQQLLAESNGSTIELMLVNQVISTWIQLHYYENREALAASDNIRVAEYRSKRVENAFKRHMKSLEALTTTKALLPKKMVEKPTPHLEAANGEPQSDRKSTENRLEAYFEMSREAASTI